MNAFKEMTIITTVMVKNTTDVKYVIGLFRTIKTPNRVVNKADRRDEIMPRFLE
jgi:hypothetical protein